MTNNIIFKEYIRKFNDKLEQKKMEPIFYRIINIDNKAFFAEEISTGAIFPTYYFCEESIPKFHSHSHIKLGKYFVYCGTIPGNNPFEFIIDENDQEMKKCDIEEVNQYLKDKVGNARWNRLMKSYEEENIYYWDLALIKEAIAKAKNNETIPHSSNTKPNSHNLSIDITKRANYNPCIDIKLIKDYGYDMSAVYTKDNFIIREEELKQMIKAIGIKNKSILLVGPPGCGKTALVKQLALMIKYGKSKWLQDKMIFFLNLTSIARGTKFRGEFEEKIQRIIDFCVANSQNIILFIDEIHRLYGLGRTEESATDGMNILKTYLSDGTITIIGATTEEEYQKYIENDPAFVERFDITRLEAFDLDFNIKILLSYISDLENKYYIKLNLNESQKIELVKYILEITDKKKQRIVNDKVKISNPRLSKSILEEAFAEALYEEKDYVEIENISFAIISCNKLSPTYRKEKAEELKEKLMSQKSGTLKLVLNTQ